mgnify:CR=1 FL=1
MEIASKYEIAAANLAIALQTDTVSVEQRSELRAAIGSSIDKLVDALNMIIVCYNKRMYAGEIAPEKAAKCVKAEYAAIGLSNVVAYDYFSAAVGAFFILHENLGVRGYIGCALMFVGIILSQLNIFKLKKAA